MKMTMMCIENKVEIKKSICTHLLNILVYFAHCFGGVGLDQILVRIFETT